MIKVYIASPYSIGSKQANVRRQIDVADRLINLGFVPHTPLLNHFHNLQRPRLYQDWIKQDLIWLLCCDCLLRLRGESKGADLEVEYAKINKIPVFYSINEIRQFYHGKEKE